MIKIKLSFVIFLCIVLYSGLLKELSNLFLVIFIHETGHLLFIILFREKIKSLEITGFGIFINATLLTNNVLKKILIYSGGILFNLFFIFIFKFDSSIEYHKIMIFFNLIPIYPLDGFQILNSILTRFYEDEFINDVLFYIGALILSILLIFSIIFNLYFLVLFSIFLSLRLYEYRKTKRLLYLNNYIKLSF